MYGTTAKILRVDLTHNTIQTETLSEDFYRMYPGGKALAGYILLNEIPPHTDPFAPEMLVFAAGLLPYVVPNVQTWKRRVLREREFTDEHDYHLHGL